MLHLTPLDHSPYQCPSFISSTCQTLRTFEFDFGIPASQLKSRYFFGQPAPLHHLYLSSDFFHSMFLRLKDEHRLLELFKNQR